MFIAGETMKLRDTAEVPSSSTPSPFIAAMRSPSVIASTWSCVT
jgi:hypothetical protein